MKIHVEKIVGVNGFSRNNLLSFAVLEGLTPHRHLLGTDKFHADENGEYEVKMTVNGVELDLERAFNQLEISYENAVEKKAVQLVREKINDLDELLNGFTKIFEDAMITKLGYDPSEHKRSSWD